MRTRGPARRGIRLLRNVLVIGLVSSPTACAALEEIVDQAQQERPPTAFDQDAQLVRNPGFESPGDPVPAGWTRDQERTRGKGAVTRDRSRAASGEASLKLTPAAGNVAEDPLAVTQIIPAGEYRGEVVQFAGSLASRGATNAILGMMSLVRGVPQGPPQMLVQPGGEDPGWVRHSGVYRVPDDPSVQLVLIAMSNGPSGESWFDDLSVLPPAPPGTGGPSGEPSRATGEPLPATVRVDASRVLRRIPETLYGTNMEWRWNGLNVWLEDEDRLDPRLVSLTRELGVTVIRYPGGYLSDFYHWREGVGPRDRRDPLLHEPGREDRSTPLFGTEEFLEFAGRVGAEGWITVNAGTGTAQEAADWVRHVNAERRRVRFWEVGNELYLDLPTPVSQAVTVDPRTYADRYGDFARAMKAADPGIRLAAIGGVNYGRYRFMGYPDWLPTLLDRQAERIDYVSIHNAYAPLVSDDGVGFRELYEAMLAAPVLIARNLETVSDLIAEHAPERKDEIAIAVTEWGPAFRFDPGSRWVDHVKTLGSALFSASVLKTLIEAPRVEVANFQMLHDFSAYGAIGSRNTDFPPDHDWHPTARYYAFQLFTRHFGERLVASDTEGPTFDSEAVGFTAAVRDAPWLDVVASLSEDGTRLHVIGINKHFDRPVEARITLEGFAPAPRGTAWTLNGTGMDAHTGTGIIEVPSLDIPRQAENPENPRFHRGGEGEITFERSDVDGVGPEFVYRFPAHSATSIILTRR